MKNDYYTNDKANYLLIIVSTAPLSSFYEVFPAISFIQNAVETELTL